MRREPKPLHLTGRDGEARAIRVMEKVEPIVCDALRECAMGQSPWPLLLTGMVGSGKSCAALALLDFVCGITQYWTVQDLCSHCIEVGKGSVRDERMRDDVRITPMMFWMRWSRSELCVLDELGQRQNVSDWNFDTTKKAIDLREGKPLIIVSNLDGEAIAACYDERIASRCVSGTVVTVTGEDRRLSATGGTA